MNAVLNVISAKRTTFLLLIWLNFRIILFAADYVPPTMEYCGLKLTFTPEARLLIQQHVDKIRKNRLALQAMVDRADLFMPYVNDAFQQIGVPKDLTYIAIQESGFRGDAVSKSNAVGFWQFKATTAQNMGLSINSLIDERKHIFRSSIGAAKYFATNYIRHGNWIYSVISYYEGGTGAIPYINEKYIGATEMLIDKNLHWYAQKAIAHKIAYEDEIGKNPNRNKYLVPYSNEGESFIENIASKHEISLTEFKEINLWVKSMTIPEDKAYSYYVLSRNRPLAHKPDPFLYDYERMISPDYKPIAITHNPKIVTRGNTPVEVSSAKNSNSTPKSNWNIQESNDIIFGKPSTPPPTVIDPNIQQLNLKEEPLYGKEFTVVTDDNTLIDIAQLSQTPLKKIRKWNNLPLNLIPRPGTIILLVPPRKATIHITRPLETVEDIAIRYKVSPEKIRQYNRLTSKSTILKEGQKIYLRSHKPRNERIVTYAIDS